MAGGERIGVGGVSKTSVGLALLGGPPVREAVRPRYPVFTKRARERVVELLESGHAVGLSKLDPVIDEVETTIARWHGLPHCLATASGHGALHSALIGLEITGGDEVLTSPYSWGASVSCILHNNAIPTFADVDPETGLLDPVDLPRRLTPRTRAILVPHILGQPAQMTAIAAFAEAHGLALIEDGSQAHGARHRGRLVGGFGDAAGFSCMGGKLLATTEAGYMVTRDPDVYFKAALAGQHAGMVSAPGRTSEPGFPEELLAYSDSLIHTYRVSTVSAVLMVEQLTKLERENEGRRSNLADLIARLDGVRSVRFPSYPEGDVIAPHMVTMNFSPVDAGIAKATYLAALRAEGVPALEYVHTALHRLERLRADTDAPRVMWTENLRRHGVDYSDLELPGTDARLAAGIELSWNYIAPDPETMAELAEAFIKVEESLDELRDYERREGIAN
jgi:dTDP-4-amino-4,6-dideoxygalactose transaminase